MVRSGSDRGGRGGPTRARQEFDPIALGFHWRAWVSLAPLLRARVVDAFSDAHGQLEARVFGVPFLRVVGPEIDKGEGQRLLAELPWCPMAVGHPALSWSATDGDTLTATYDAGYWRASVHLQVDEHGRVLSASADDRPRQVGKSTTPTRWIGRYGGYRQFGEMRVPASFRVDWEPAEGPFTYVRGEICDAGIILPR